MSASRLPSAMEPRGVSTAANSPLATRPVSITTPSRAAWARSVRWRSSSSVALAGSTCSSTECTRVPNSAPATTSASGIDAALDVASTTAGSLASSATSASSLPPVTGALGTASDHSTSRVLVMEVNDQWRHIGSATRRPPVGATPSTGATPASAAGAHRTDGV